METSIIKGSGGSEMEEFVRSCPHSLLYATPPFLDLLANHLAHALSMVGRKGKGSSRSGDSLSSQRRKSWNGLELLAFLWK